MARRMRCHSVHRKKRCRANFVRRAGSLWRVFGFCVFRSIVQRFSDAMRCVCVCTTRCRFYIAALCGIFLCHQPIPDPTPDDPEPLMASEIVYEFVETSGPEPDFYVAPPAAPPAPIRGRLRAGADVRAPTIVRKIDPIYPELAIRAHLECTVILEAVIGTDGAIIDIEVQHSCGMGLDDAAINAVAQWHYAPTLFNGRPVEVVAIVRVVFKLS